MQINLNKNQLEAVVSDSKNIRIIAGAGSGKTRVLISRIQHLIESGITYPHKILAITFTNKAANEMKERLSASLGLEANKVWISTIHSLCVRILREDIVVLNYPRNFTVMDADDQKVILKEAYKQYDIEKNKISFASMLAYISSNKCEGIDVDKAFKYAYHQEDEEKKALVYKYYCERQNALYALDFDDLLLFVVKMFAQYPEVLTKWQKRFSHIHVDEFQDIDNIQYQLIKYLSGEHNHVYVVGDPDQTIYTWRGADVNIIMDFDRDFSPCQTIILNENYRSTPQILNGANSLIKNNKNRVKKDLFTNHDDAQKIIHYSSASEEYEALWIANKILEFKQHQISYNDIAILYRSNYLSRYLEKSLLDAHIPYVIYGGIRFYERMEIKDALCYLRMIQQADDLAFMRIINQPKRGLGNKSLDKIASVSQSLGCSFFEAISKQKILSGKNQKTLDDFVAMILRWRQKAETMSIAEMLEMVLDESGYRFMLEDEKEIERLENLKELINDINVFCATYPQSGLDEYLQLVALYGERSQEDNSEFVRLMTIHASKGLEFDQVFLAGCNEGVFPSDRSLQDGIAGLEEERRLAYVAMTRAKKQLFITESGGFSYILQRPKVRSRFINEIAEEYIEHLGMQVEKTVSEPQVNFEDTISIKPKSKLKKGDLVEHGIFKDGIVLKVENNIAEIAFSYPYGVKKIMANHPSIKKKD